MALKDRFCTCDPTNPKPSRQQILNKNGTNDVNVRAAKSDYRIVEHNWSSENAASIDVLNIGRLREI